MNNLAPVSAGASALPEKEWLSYHGYLFVAMLRFGYCNAQYVRIPVKSNLKSQLAHQVAAAMCSHFIYLFDFSLISPGSS